MRFVRRFWITTLPMALCGPLAFANSLPAVQFYQATAYICGGIGSDQAALFRSTQSQYPLSLNFGQKWGHKVALVADVQVVMRDEYEQTVLNINSDGPFCLLDIDPGNYRVYATYEGQTLQQSVTVEQKNQRLSFIWPENGIN